jgi:hypothetical protein
MRNVVVLPAPLAPSRVTISPSFLHLEGDVVQNLNGAVGGVDVIDY